MSNTDAVKEMHSEIYDAIVEIDEKLDSLSDSGSAGKRKITNDLVSSAETLWGPIVAKLVSEIKNLENEPDKMVGAFKGIVNNLNSQFNDAATSHIESLVEVAPKVEPLITEEEAAVLSDQRSELYKNCKNLIELAETMYGLELPKPKVRRGAVGKRGARNTTKMDWAVNGEPLDTDFKYKDVAEAVGFETLVNDKGKEVSPVSQLTAFLKSKDIDTQNATEIEVTLPNGDVLTGWIPEDEGEEESE